MTGRISLLATVSISVLALSVGGAAAGERKLPATHVRGEVHRVIAASPGSITLYDQNSDDSDAGILSTNFTDFDSFDSYGADDFTVPVGHKWKIRQIEVSGSYAAGDGNAGPAASESVFFYRDNHGLPGELVAKCEQIKGKDNQGSFAIKLPKSCKVVLKSGNRYWISVFANMDIACCGQWNWSTRDGQNGKPAAWENPGGGFRICPVWEHMITCMGDAGEGPDFRFALKGKDIEL